MMTSPRQMENGGPGEVSAFSSCGPERSIRTEGATRRFCQRHL
ncbi:MAG TPA: hypothetical protein VI306_19910 [Pyrinomonadaceae bacterium]